MAEEISEETVLRRPRGYSDAAGARSDAPRAGAEPVSPSLRDVLLIGGCAAATPALVARATAFEALSFSSQAAVLVGAVCGATALAGGALWALGLWRLRDRAPTAALSGARAARGLSLEDALFGQGAARDPQAWMSEGVDPARFHAELLAASEPRPTPRRPSAEEGACRAPRAEPPFEAAPAAEAAPHGDVAARRRKLLWSIHEMSRDATARRKAALAEGGAGPR